MAGAAEEAREEVERIVAAAGAATLLVLGEAFVAVLVVDLSCFGRGEGVVGVGDLDELLGCGVIATVPQRNQLRIRKVFSLDVGKFVGRGRAYGFLSGWYFLLSSRYAFFISRSEADLSRLRRL